MGPRRRSPGDDIQLSPGISLKQEGFSYIAGAELPALSPILSGPVPEGGILPSQGDYFQATKGGGHGDYRNIVLAPASVQELYEMTIEAFNLADRYRMLALILGDGALGQMMEPVVFRDKEPIDLPKKPWADRNRRRPSAQYHYLYLYQGRCAGGFLIGNFRPNMLRFLAGKSGPSA